MTIFLSPGGTTEIMTLNAFESLEPATAEKIFPLSTAK